MRFRRTLALLPLVAAALHAGDSVSVRAASAAEPNADWTTTLDSEMGWQRPTPAGVLVVATSNGLLGLDGANGETLWRIPDLRKPGDVTLDAQLRPPYVALRLDPGTRGDTVLFVIDVTTGREAWNSSTLGLREVHRQFYVPALDALVVSGRVDKQIVAVVVDLASGRRLRMLEPPPKGVGPDLKQVALLDTDTTLVIAAEAGLSRYNLATGALDWTVPKLHDGKRKKCVAASSAPNVERTDPRPLPALAAMQPSRDGRRIFVVHGSTLHAVDALDGHSLWHDPPELCGRVVAAYEVEGGVVVWTMPEVIGCDELVMLDGASGAVKWTFPKINRSLGALFKAIVDPQTGIGDPVARDGAMHAFHGKDLVRVDLATGESEKLGRTEMEVEAGPPTLEALSEGWLAVGQQDVEWLDPKGNSLRRVHYDPPHDVGGALVKLGVAAAAASALGSTVHAGSHVTMSYSADYAKLYENFEREFHATTKLDSVLFMLADLEGPDLKGPALVAMNRQTGDVLRRIPVTTKLHYAIDTAHDRVFVERWNTLRCYRF